MWKIKIKIVDEISNLEENIIYPIQQIFRYFDLLEILHKIYPIAKYDTCIIKFSFYFNDKKIVVDDYSNYILNNESIEISISRRQESPSPLYLYHLLFNDKFKSSYDIKELYKYYFENLKNFDVFLIEEKNGKRKLLDVLISKNLFYNRCVNRMISKYYY
jgi:hypothetical protein